MAQKNIHHRSARFTLRQCVPVFALGILAVTGSFAVGIRTAGDVRPIDAMEAHEPSSITGDMNGDDMVDVRDVLEALDIALGTIAATPAQLKADPTADGRLTIEDARQIAALASH